MKFLAVLTFVCCTLVARAAETFTEPDTGLVFPPALGAWKQTDVHHYPEKEYGVSIGYNRGPGHTMTIYLYSGGFSEIPTGGDSDIMRAVLKEVNSQIAASWVKEGAVVKALVPHRVLRDSVCPGVFALGSVYRMSFPEHVATSYTGITGYKNRILKLRYTFNSEDSNIGAQNLDEFITELVKANAANLDPFFACAAKENYGWSK